MGTPKFSVRTLEVLIKSEFKISCVYTQQPKKSSRGQKIKKTPVQLAAEIHNLNVRSPSDINDEEEYLYFKSLAPYLVIVVAYGQIIPKRFLELPEKGFLNIHASLLPKLRGAAPIQRSIINSEKETGISIMKIEEGLDTGPYMKQVKINIDKQTNSEELSKKLSELGAKNILGSIDLITNNQAKFIKQDSNNVTYAKKISKSESEIDWNETAQKIISKINGLNPNPGVWFKHNGNRIKILEAEISEHLGKKGEVITNDLVIGCQDKSIKINTLQKEGKIALNAKSFLAGYKIVKGDNLI